jgi:gliding motility-associated-like protein
MFKKAFLLLFILSVECMVAQITLTHNICNDIKETGFSSCTSGMQHWARAFYLSDFGISNNEEFIINSGQIGISDHGGGSTVTFYIYEIDNNFPNVFSESNLIGSSKEIQIPYVYGNDNSGTIFEIEFDTPVKVDYTVERILVVAKVGAVWGSGVIFIGGTEQDYDHSWFRGCVTGEYEKFTIVGENFNFFINVTGYTNHITNNFEMNISNICSEFLKEFSIEKKENIASIVWDFGDPTSGTENTSIDISPYHDFTMDGTYTITATVTSIDGSVIVLTETINVIEPPNAYGIDNIYACEDSVNSGFSSSFDISDVEAQLLGGQTDKIITYIDGNGNEYDSLPNPFTNTVENQETITVRVAHENNLCCYSETTFDLIVNPLPEINEINGIFACDDNNDGIADFDISNLESIISDNQSGMILEFFYENGQPLPNPLPNIVQNMVLNQESITARITDPNSNCYNESSFDLIVNPLPEANQLQIIYGCDDNNDGISEYFDTSNVESQVLNGQIDKFISYFDQTGNELPNPLPNPYTNSAAFNELITVRVTDNNSTCYAETTLQLQTVTQPNINQPNNLYSCDQGNGYAEFNTSNIEQQLIANQTGLSIQYYDSDNNPLPSPLPELFQNTEPFSQTINVRVEDISNPICYTETSFDLIINELPEINLEDEYYLCNLEPSISLSINSGFNSYNWSYQDDTSISNTNNAEITEEGSYTLTVTQIENGIACENSFDFTLVRSVLPEIQQVNFGELGDNYIEIIASGDGDFEYSIDGINYQDSNYFSNIQGGMYSVFVRDKDGCGQDSEEVTVIDYPKFFTPNDDGYNDFWQIRGIANFPNSETFIFDRYGKLLARISSNDLGWNGQYNGRQMMSNDYWFRTDLGNGRTLSGHFSLKR